MSYSYLNNYGNHVESFSKFWFILLMKYTEKDQLRFEIKQIDWKLIKQVKKIVKKYNIIN